MCKRRPYMTFCGVQGCYEPIRNQVRNCWCNEARRARRFGHCSEGIDVCLTEGLHDSKAKCRFCKAEAMRARERRKAFERNHPNAGRRRSGDLWTYFTGPVRQSGASQQPEMSQQTESGENSRAEDQPKRPKKRIPTLFEHLELMPDALTGDNDVDNSIVNTTTTTDVTDNTQETAAATQEHEEPEKRFQVVSPEPPSPPRGRGRGRARGTRASRSRRSRSRSARGCLRGRSRGRGSRSLESTPTPAPAVSPAEDERNPYGFPSVREQVVVPNINEEFEWEPLEDASGTWTG
ncbi:hypothetical protein F5Y04DRAFT_291808 [Hypomontagnella monticulosa]|nr:hypothetical protein F5Y04DRAFT_291808 [Hypomontagnella monticulosa]